MTGQDVYAALESLVLIVTALICGYIMVLGAYLMAPDSSVASAVFVAIAIFLLWMALALTSTNTPNQVWNSTVGRIGPLRIDEPLSELKEAIDS